MNAAITIDGIGKKYRIGMREQRHANFREALVGALTAPIRRFRQLGEHTSGEDEIWALRNVSFEVPPGEVVGIIGRNGAGKSTLLKILSRITEPTEGTARIRGRVGSLLEVGTGFHAELSGRENIYLNGAILGMKKTEIDARFDEIVEFSGVEKFLDTPVKRYSSGMYVRLAFAVAAHLEPEILIVDEVLAVGDVQFQRKCLGKMQDVARRSGRTILFVSHNIDAILGLCSHVVVMDDGHNSPVLPPEEAVRLYLQSFGAGSSQVSLRDAARIRHEPGPSILAHVEIRNDDGPASAMYVGESLTMVITLEHLDQLNNPAVGIVITDFRSRRVAAFHTRIQEGIDLPGDSCVRLACRIPSLPLVPGRYNIDLTADDGVRSVECVERAAEFEVTFADLFGTGKLPSSKQGCIALPCYWSTESESD